MFNSPVLSRINIVSPYNLGSFNGLHWYNRIDMKLALGLICEVLIDGAGRTGKTTSADYICQRYDKNYVLVYTIKDILNHIKGLWKLYKQEEYHLVFNRWINWDEPEAEVPKAKFWDEKNFVSEQIVGTWGFLYQHMALSLPDTSRIRLSPNVLMKITMCVKGRKPNLSYIGLTRLPYFNQKTQRWGWGLNPVEQINFPQHEIEKGYLEHKINNFFHNFIPRWETELKADEPAYFDVERNENIKKVKKRLNTMRAKFHKLLGNDRDDMREQIAKVRNQLIDLKG
jgi:hypothetical protein